MKNTAFIAGILLSMSCFSTPLYATPRSISGVGFDWLQPKSECAAITIKDPKILKNCKHSAASSFGLDILSYACRTGKHHEVIIFANQEECQEALDTLLANGP